MHLFSTQMYSAFNYFTNILVKKCDLLCVFSLFVLFNMFSSSIFMVGKFVARLIKLQLIFDKNVLLILIFAPK